MSNFNPAKSPAWYRWYVIGALALVYAINVMDRALVTILQVPIKQELGLSDAQLGLLTGLAFAVFYATLAIPIARFADRSNRVAVVCACLALWSLMTAGCGVAMGFVTLLLFRMGVGVGEAGGYPPSASVLSDYFSRHKRATALAIFGLGAPVGHTLGLFAGGWLNDAYGWRNAFIIAGVAGLALAPIIFFTVKEPQRGVSDDADEQSAHGAPAANLREVATVLWRLKTIRFLYVANMCHAFAIYAYQSWLPPFYVRIFDLSTGTVANWLGLLSIAGATGTFLGGMISDRLGRRDPRWYLWSLAAAGIIITPAAIIQFLATDLSTSLWLALVPSVLLHFYVGPTIATGQSLVQPQMRATSAAFMLMLFNIFGLGLGPFFVGALSDAFGATMGEDGLRYALVVGVLIELVAVCFWILAGRHFASDMARDRTLDFEPSPRLATT